MIAALDTADDACDHGIIVSRNPCAISCECGHRCDDHQPKGPCMGPSKDGPGARCDDDCDRFTAADGA